MLDNVRRLSHHFLKNYNREYVRYFIKRQILENRFSIIVGQRGVGKSTALIQHLHKYVNGDSFSKKILYVQSDHFITAKYSLYEIAEEFINFGGELICFDEVHKYKGWSEELKSIYDTFPSLKMIASGSSILEIHKGSHDLSRRAVIHEINGMSFREFIELSYGVSLPEISLGGIISRHASFTHEIIKLIEEKGLKILPLFQDYLKFGYYPYFQEFDEMALFHITLEQQIHTTIESDLLSVYPSLSGESIRKLKKLLSVISTNVPFTPDIKKLMNIINVGDGRTLKAYLKYLEDGGIILQFGKSGRLLNSLEKPEKIYLNNTNQLYALSMINDVHIGTARKTFFANIMRNYKLTIPKKGDFMIDNKITFEVGGKNKQNKQISQMPTSYLALDGIENGINHKIPLWVFGFTY